MITITMTGLEEVIKTCKSLADEKKVQKLQHNLVLYMKREAKKLCPVDTGHMRNTIYMRRMGKFGYELGVTAHYAVWNEFGPMNRGKVPVGTDKNPKFHKGGYRPFMRPAVWKGMKQLPKLFKQIYNI